MVVVSWYTIKPIRLPDMVGNDLITRSRNLQRDNRKGRADLHLMRDIIVPYDCHTKPVRKIRHCSTTRRINKRATARVDVVTVLETNETRTSRLDSRRQYSKQVAQRQELTCAPKL